MTQAFLDEFAETNGFIGAIRVSAKTGHNVNSSFLKVVKEIFFKEIQASNEMKNPGGGMTSGVKP